MDNKVFKTVGIIAVVLCMVICVSFAYASVTNKLSVEGYASMESANWDVHFENLSNANLKGTTVEIKKPTLQNNSTSIASFDVKLMKSNDGVSYSFDVVNAGDIDAKISSIVIPKPICTGTGVEAQKDSEVVCNNLIYSLTYADKTSIDNGDILKKGEKKSFILTLEYKGADLPKDIVEISGLSIALIYVQK